MPTRRNLATPLFLTLAAGAAVAGPRLDALMAERAAARARGEIADHQSRFQAPEKPAMPAAEVTPRVTFRSDAEVADPLADPGAKLGALLKVDLPNRRRVRSMRLTLDAAPERLTEVQASARPDAYLAVGRRMSASVAFLPGGNVRKDTGESAEAVAVFLSQPAVKLHWFGVNVMAYKDGDDLRTRGRTPPIGRLEVFKVREVGDFRGESVAVVEDISFELGGATTKVQLELETDPNRRYMVVLSVPAEEGHERFVNIPAATEGEYPALRLSPKNGVPVGGKKSRRYHAGVHFSYRPDPVTVRPAFDVEGDFLDAIQRYLRENPKADNIPLRVRVL